MFFLVSFIACYDLIFDIYFLGNCYDQGSDMFLWHTFIDFAHVSGIFCLGNFNFLCYDI